MQQVMNGEIEGVTTAAGNMAASAPPAEAAPTARPMPASAVEREPAVRPGEDAILGRIALLFLRSPAHRLLFLQDLDWRVLPPLRLGQTRVFMQGGRPFAYASWAFLSPEVAARIAAGDPRLRPADWKSGDEPWLIDLVAPRGATDSLIKLIEAKMLGGRTLRRRGTR